MTAPLVAELASELAALRAEVAALRAEVAAAPARTAAPRGDGHASARFAAIYPAFQDRFRGSEADVRGRLAVYLPHVEALGPEAGPVVDVGPGRGEWLAMLAERGVRAYGVEANGPLVELLRGRDLEVVHGDAIAHLASLPPGTLGVVTAFHVVEHLELDTLLALLAAARRALRPGGTLLLETPDPTNLVMAACNFRFDPTHLQPLPPALLEFLVGASGFVDARIWPLHPKAEVDLGALRLEGVDPRVAAMLAESLRKAFFGSQDYAVVAHAPSGHGSPGDPRGPGASDSTA